MIPILDPREVSTSTVNASLAELLAETPEEEQRSFLAELLEAGGEDALIQFENSWLVHGRPAQQQPNFCADPKCGCEGSWNVWLILSGRAWGKTRTGAETCHQWASDYPGCRILIIAPTAGDLRRVTAEGESGLVGTEKPWNPCKYEPTLTQIRWENGSIGYTISADEPDRIRGVNAHFAWCDETAAWKKAQEVWDMMRLALRLPPRPTWGEGYRPRVIVTTTPRPTELIRRLAGGRGFRKGSRTHVTTGSSYDNRSNLSEDFFESIISDLEGTRLGDQELWGKILDDVPGAMWRSSIIDPFRIDPEQLPERLKTVCVAVDPSVGGSNETGIIVTGCGPAPSADLPDMTPDAHSSVALSLRRNQRIHGYVMADLSGGGLTPDAWARRAVRAYHEYGANCIVAEANNGGDLVRYTIHTVDPNVPVKLVHAQRRKKTRAEPVVALYEQGRIHHVGKLSLLEDQLLTWDPEVGESPDRLDAMVWGLHHLMGKGKIHSGSAPIRIGAKEPSWNLQPIAGGM